MPLNGVNMLAAASKRTSIFPYSAQLKRAVGRLPGLSGKNRGSELTGSAAQNSPVLRDLYPPPDLFPRSGYTFIPASAFFSETHLIAKKNLFSTI